MDVVQTYTVFDAAQVEPMLKGAPEGWRQTLDKLEAEVARLHANGGGRSVVHDVFHIERTYDATAEQVYKALSDEVAKSRWFYGPEGWRLIERTMDVRVGGRERVKGASRARDDYVRRDLPRRGSARAPRLHLRDAYRRRKISVSLATLEIEPAGAGRTKLKICEQGAFLDGYDDCEMRQRGTGGPYGQAGASLDPRSDVR